MLQAALALVVALLAEGRGSNPSEAGGVAIVVGIAVLVAAAAAAGMWLVVRRRGRG